MPLTVVPPGARLLHIGPHKTGTTAIQVALHNATQRLAEHGVAYPTGTEDSYRARRAGWSLGLRGRPAGSEPPSIELWRSLVRDVEAQGEHRVCVSNEDFGRAEPDQVTRIVGDLGGDRVHVVAVSRRLDRYLPSQWQERVKAGEQRSYEEWLRVVLDTADDEPDWDRRNVWFSHDVDALTRRWLAEVPPERFTLIVADEGDRTQLPRTFEALLGLPEETLRPDPQRSNRSLTWAETELVREINVALADATLTRPQRRRFVVRGVLADLQARPASGGPGSPPLPAWARDQLAALGQARADAVRALAAEGVRVVGDADAQLLPDDAPLADGPLTAPPLDPQVAAGAVAGVIAEATRPRP